VTAGEAKAAIPVIESLGKKGIEVHVGCQSRWCASYFSRHVTRRFRYVPPEKEPERFVDQLYEIVKSENYAALIPVGDIITALISANQDRFRQHTGLLLPDNSTFIKGRDKQKTLKIAIANDIACPMTYFPDETDINELRGLIKYPVVVKPAISHGARGITIVLSKKDLIPSYKAVRRKFGPCFVQEYISQAGTQYKADVLVDRNGNLKAGVVYSKLRYYPLEGGSSILNQTVERPDILAAVDKLLKAMHWYGFADFDFIVDPADGVAKLMEINPRFPESFRITLAAGIDFPYMIYQMATGRDVDQCNGYRKGIYSRFLLGDLLWFIKSPNRFRAEPSFFKFFDKNLHYYILNAEDPKLVLGYILENLDIKKIRSRLSRTSSPNDA
jgi:predicted ATP-grasp superfamily ATP-dependent carboligase